MQEHDKAKYHKTAYGKSLAMMPVAEGQTPDIQQQVAGKSQDFYRNQNRLISISKTLLGCAKQDIALRGHRNESLTTGTIALSTNVGDQQVMTGDINRGNFLYLLRTRADAGDKALAVPTGKREKFCAPSIQNELLALMANQVSTEIAARISKSPFSIIADETTDVSTAEQMCVAVRYIEEGEVLERFLTFVKLYGLKGM